MPSLVSFDKLLDRVLHLLLVLRQQLSEAQDTWQGSFQNDIQVLKKVSQVSKLSLERGHSSFYGSAPMFSFFIAGMQYSAA